jgi:phosphorylcholine metabolism protein LicD
MKKKVWPVVLISVIGFIILLGVLVVLVYVRPLSKKQLQFVHSKLKERLSVFIQILKKYNYSYFIESGTLLGAVRNKDIIPWDDDIDIGMLQTDLDSLMSNESALHELRLNHLSINVGPPFYSLYKLQCTNCPDEIFIDIFGYDVTESKLIYHAAQNKKQWPYNWFYLKNVYPLKTYMLGNLEVKGPNKHEPYLKRVYGSTWYRPKKGLFSHSHILRKTLRHI